MERLIDKNNTSSSNSTPELKNWESPELFIEDMAKITEVSNFMVPKGEDGFYQS